MIAVIVPYYKREELTTLCFKQLERQSKKFGFTVFVCGDGNVEVPKSFKVVECDNNPLGNKNNTLLQATKGFDAVTIIGSDDFVSDSVFELFNSLDLSKEVYYGFDNFHVYSVWHDKLGTDSSYCKSRNTIGVGRLWTKPTLKKMNYTLWTKTKNIGLDTDSKNRMLSNGIEEVKLSYDGYFILDVKQDYNITSPNLVNTCDTFNDPQMIIAELGSIGNDILALEKGDIKQIKREKMKKVKVLIDCIEVATGQKKKLPIALYKAAKAKGIVSDIVEVVEAPKKRTPKKK